MGCGLAELDRVSGPMGSLLNIIVKTCFLRSRKSWDD